MVNKTTPPPQASGAWLKSEPLSPTLSTTSTPRWPPNASGEEAKPRSPRSTAPLAAVPERDSNAGPTYPPFREGVGLRFPRVRKLAAVLCGIGKSATSSLSFDELCWWAVCRGRVEAWVHHHWQLCPVLAQRVGDDTPLPWDQHQVLTFVGSNGEYLTERRGVVTFDNYLLVHHRLRKLPAPLTRDLPSVTTFTVSTYLYLLFCTQPFRDRPCPCNRRSSDDSQSTDGGRTERAGHALSWPHAPEAALLLDATRGGQEHTRCDPVVYGCDPAAYREEANWAPCSEDHYPPQGRNLSEDPSLSEDHNLSEGLKDRDWKDRDWKDRDWKDRDWKDRDWKDRDWKDPSLSQDCRGGRRRIDNVVSTEPEGGDAYYQNSRKRNCCKSLEQASLEQNSFEQDSLASEREPEVVIFQHGLLESSMCWVLALWSALGDVPTLDITGRLWGVCFCWILVWKWLWEYGLRQYRCLRPTYDRTLSRARYRWSLPLRLLEERPHLHVWMTNTRGNEFCVNLNTETNRPMGFRPLAFKDLRRLFRIYWDEDWTHVDSSVLDCEAIYQCIYEPPGQASLRKRPTRGPLVVGFSQGSAVFSLNAALKYHFAHVLPAPLLTFSPQDDFSATATAVWDWPQTAPPGASGPASGGASATDFPSAFPLPSVAAQREVPTTNCLKHDAEGTVIKPDPPPTAAANPWTATHARVLRRTTDKQRRRRGKLRQVRAASGKAALPRTHSVESVASAPRPAHREPHPDGAWAAAPTARAAPTPRADESPDEAAPPAPDEAVSDAAYRAPPPFRARLFGSSTPSSSAPGSSSMPESGPSAEPEFDESAAESFGPGRRASAGCSEIFSEPRATPLVFPTGLVMLSPPLVIRAFALESLSGLTDFVRGRVCTATWDYLHWIVLGTELLQAMLHVRLGFIGHIFVRFVLGFNLLPLHSRVADLAYRLTPAGMTTRRNMRLWKDLMDGRHLLGEKLVYNADSRAFIQQHWAPATSPTGAPAGPRDAAPPGDRAAPPEKLNVGKLVTQFAPIKIYAGLEDNIADTVRGMEALLERCVGLTETRLLDQRSESAARRCSLYEAVGGRPARIQMNLVAGSSHCDLLWPAVAQLKVHDAIMQDLQAILDARNPFEK
ncbi:hypothetical protein GNI_038900 [Gregarina niphandrodes]|uniref:Uncharacterized protein n=1 Tax=Gregarina niphandrodes TaxID=110365 RepID=A0A023BAG1_GRENI|nr:hypothetical protein GNI_038900 [Gregarina niphandrodes]EZG78268.1 hypothetical protein GNI_038900 [Gregarina niphandrodes]|eukprot:XP_011129373.1 hypothetical protein GNI_038900 [Gregarina niphandrodes]